MKPTLHVYLTHFVKKSAASSETKLRRMYLATCLFSLSQILSHRLSVTVISNVALSHFLELCEPIHSRIDGSVIRNQLVETDELEFRELRSDWLLTWAHKPIMWEEIKNAKAKENHSDLFLAIEDDALFSQSNLDYFVEERRELEPIGIIPSFIRQEWSTYDSCWIHTDSFSRISNSRIMYPHPRDPNKQLMQLPNPFCATTLLDVKLGIEYFSSESSLLELALKKQPYICDIGSAASLGLISERIPKGFIYRVA